MGNAQVVFEKEFSSVKFITYNDEPEIDKKFVNQVHGSVVVSTDIATSSIEADGLYQQEEFKDTLAIRTADCLPIAVFGKNGHALLHAGWRGVELDIMSAQEVENISPTLFFLGPHIRSCCYEVQLEFIESFQFSDNFIRRDDKIYFNMANECRERIIKSFPDTEVEISDKCTCCSPEFRSYRENKTKLRNWNILFPN